MMGAHNGAHVVSELGQPNSPTDDQTIELGQTALQRIRGANTFADWVQVGHAHVVLRERAMRAAQTDVPNGGPYSTAFAALLSKYGFDGIDKHDRSDLFKIMDNIDAIQQWYGTLTSTEKLKTNHPSTVWRKYTAATKPPRPPRETVRTALAQQIAENDRLKAEAAIPAILDEAAFIIEELSNEYRDSAENLAEKFPTKAEEHEACADALADLKVPEPPQFVATEFKLGKNPSRRKRLEYTRQRLEDLKAWGEKVAAFVEEVETLLTEADEVELPN